MSTQQDISKQSKDQILRSASERVSKHMPADGRVEVYGSVDTKQIVLPDGMAADDAIVHLMRKDAEEKRVVTIREIVDAYPLDGALALHRAMAKIYGWVNLVPTPSFFGDEPPAMIGVQVGPNENDTVQVPWGRMKIPGVTGFIETGMFLKDERPVFMITGQVLRKQEKDIKALAQTCREILRESSIYRGQAIRVHFPDLDDGPSPDDFNPRFIDVSRTDPNELVFPQEVMDLIRTNLFTPIEKTQLCRDNGIPLKRGILLAGPYGVGKTLTAHVAAKKCVENGWTFIYLDHVEDLQKAIYFAQQYSPAMIFAEDIDRLISDNADTDRSDKVNGILNVIDGVDTKKSEVLIALTTNHIGRINQALLRPGRLDAVISVSPPDAAAAERLVRQYGRGLVHASEDLTEAGVKLAGKIPAVIREVVERAKLSAIDRSTGGPLAVSAKDIVISVESMLGHLDLLRPIAEDTRSDIEKAATIVAKAFGGDKTSEKTASNGSNGSSRSPLASATSGS
jgi:transitional endoplasmic reticulum ATPase